jgi:hypothetical protein
MSDSDEPALSVTVCSECGNPIARSAGRFNLGERRYHEACYDRLRHSYNAAQQPEADKPRR